jgi:putative transposase
VHLVARGHNRGAIVTRKADYLRFYEHLNHAATTYQVNVHAWVIMTNHIHILATPDRETSLAKCMQWIGRNYAHYFNRTYKRSGSLWEGRYKTSLIDSGAYLLCCYRYIELNPVRATIVQHPADYPWSSYRSNAVGAHDKLVTPHTNYLSLGSSEKERQDNYRRLFKDEVDPATLKKFRRATNNCEPVGSSEFILNVGRLAGGLSGSG